MGGYLGVVLVLAVLIAIVIAKTAVVVPAEARSWSNVSANYHSTLGAGFHMLVPFVDVSRYRRCSLKEAAADIPEQVITRDNDAGARRRRDLPAGAEPERASYGVRSAVRRSLQPAQTRCAPGSARSTSTRPSRRGHQRAGRAGARQSVRPLGHQKVLRYEIKEHHAAAGRRRRDGEADAPSAKRRRDHLIEGQRDAAINQAEGESSRSSNSPGVAPPTWMNGRRAGRRPRGRHRDGRRPPARSRSRQRVPGGPEAMRLPRR